MREFFLLFIVVLLVIAHHQGACWLESPDAPFSAVRHLSASRQLRDAENALENASGGEAVTPRSSKLLLSLDLTTVVPFSSTPLQSNQDFAENSEVLKPAKKKEKGKKLRNKKKKKRKDTLSGENDENVPWHTSHSNVSTSASSSDDSDPLMGSHKERRKHRNKLRRNKERFKMDDQEEKSVTRKKHKAEKLREEQMLKSEKSEDEKIKKDKKRKKERRKQRKEAMRQQMELKKEKEEQRSYNFPPDSSLFEISKKSRSKSKMKQDVINPELIPSSSENIVEAMTGKSRKRAHDNANIDRSNDNSLETIKNEINAGELSDKLFPVLYNPHKEQNLKSQGSLDNNKLPHEISFTDVKEEITDNRKDSSLDLQSPLKNYFTTTTDPAVTTSDMIQTSASAMHKKDATKTESDVIVTTHLSLSEKEFESQIDSEPGVTASPITEGDLSCLNGTFLPAPSVKNAEIKYMRGKYLEAEYECLPDHKLVPPEAPRLVCSKRKWLGELPQCFSINRSNNNFLTASPDNKGLNISTHCGENRGGCEQLCSLVEEKPVCSCFRGFRLEGSTCHDIDECSNSNGGCEVTCHNKPGSYQCGCPSGYRLSVNGKTCLDINECLLRNGHGPCQDTCHNLPGSYTCSCEGIEGTRLASNNHSCEDLDECARNNAGCSHTCLNTLGRAFCLCPPGFMLGTDWKTCHDIDECADPELQEGERCSVGCVNTVGSYFCEGLRDQAPADILLSGELDTTTVLATTMPPLTTTAPVLNDCLPGFEAGPFGSCKDIDECAVNNGGCSHTCKNTLGSAFCLCPPGFMLTNDWKTCNEMEILTTEKPRLPAACPAGHVLTSGGRCKDIDECAIQNGGCMQGCVNTRGSFQCVCGRDFYLAADAKTCVEERVDIVCPPLPTPSYGYLHCTRRVFMVAPERWRARWRRRIVNHAGAICELRCPHGYKVHGVYRKVCEADGNWAGPEDGYCMPLKSHHDSSNEIPQIGSAQNLRSWRSWYGIPSRNSRNYIRVTYAFPKPKIECPHNISMEIEPGQATAFVAFPQPITDVDWFRNVVSKPTWGKLLEADLPLGHWTVTFTARHPISRHTASCTLGITITSLALSTEIPKELA